MKKILVACAARSLHTSTIANHVADRIGQRGWAAPVMDVAAMDPFDDGPEAYDAVVLCGSAHRGKHEPEVLSFARGNRAWLSTRPAAFLSISMAAATAEDEAAPSIDREKARRTVEAWMDRFLVETGWVPTLTKTVAGALTYPRYSVIVRLMLKPITNGATGATASVRQRVYTDWDALDRFVDQFVGSTCREYLTPVTGRSAKATSL